MLGNLMRIANICLAQLQESSTLTHKVERGVHELVRKGVQDDIHPNSASACREALLELRISRRGDLCLLEPERFECAPLVGPCGAKHIGTEPAGDLYGGH